MMETLYIDSNIFLNVVLEEESSADSSYQLLRDIEKGKYSSVTSILTVMEIHRILQKYGKEEHIIGDLIQTIPSIGIEIIVPGGEDLMAAYEYVRTSKIDPADAIHLSIAVSSSTVFITRDKELAGKIKKTIKTKTPEEL